jgi:hypothetical protein
MKSKMGFGLVGLIVLIFIILVAAAIMVKPVVGLFPFGPQSEVTAKVSRLYVDYSGEESSYMVGTDRGVFEVDNSLWLRLWDADKRYSEIKEGGTYRFRVKGREMLNILFQSYPGIVAVEQVE